MRGARVFFLAGISALALGAASIGTMQSASAEESFDRCRNANYPAKPWCTDPNRVVLGGGGGIGTDPSEPSGGDDGGGEGGGGEGGGGHGHGGHGGGHGHGGGERGDDDRSDDDAGDDADDDTGDDTGDTDDR